jgi:hypothetical protein
MLVGEDRTMAELVSRSIVTVDGLSASGGVGTPAILITHHLWIDWTQVAFERLAAARQSRQTAEAAKVRGENWAAEFEREQRASLVSVSASAHAIDAVYGALREFAGESSLNREKASRHQYICEALRKCFVVNTNADARWLANELKWLSSIRDSAVHYREAARPTEEHPIEGHGSDVAATYSLKSANRAFTVLVFVLRLISTLAIARSDAARAYAENAHQIATTLLDSELQETQ